MNEVNEYSGDGALWWCGVELSVETKTESEAWHAS